MTMPESVPAAPEKPTRPRRSAAAKGASPKSAGPKSVRKASAPAAHTGHGWMWAAMVALAIASGGSVAGLWFLELAARDAQNKHLETAIQAQLQTAAAGQPAALDAGKLAALDARIGAVEKHVAGVAEPASIKETEAATALLAEKIEGLSGRIGDIEKTLAQFKTGNTGSGDAAALELAQQEAKKNAEGPGRPEGSLGGDRANSAYDRFDSVRPTQSDLGRCGRAIARGTGFRKTVFPGAYDGDVAG